MAFSGENSWNESRTWSGIVWYQGENDVFRNETADGYLGNVTQFIADVRQEMYNVDTTTFDAPSDIPVAIVGMGCWIYTLLPPRFAGPTVILAQMEYAATAENVVFVPIDDLSCHWHLDDASQLIIGERVALALQTILPYKSPRSPSSQPSQSSRPTQSSSSPSQYPSSVPTGPSNVPSEHPSVSSVPSVEPSIVPSSFPSLTLEPSLFPSDLPSVEPSLLPSSSSSPSVTESTAPSVSFRTHRPTYTRIIGASAMKGVVLPVGSRVAGGAAHDD